VATHSPALLLVDDETSLLHLLGRALERAGLTVYLAADGAEAIDLVHRHPNIRAALLDVCLPDADGPALLQTLRAMAPDLRFVFMTGNFSADEAALLGKGAEAVLFKPFSIYELTAVGRLLLTAAAVPEGQMVG
jgi:two-component system OmpR family response regulator